MARLLGRLRKAEKVRDLSREPVTDLVSEPEGSEPDADEARSVEPG
jgi:hypothetical protein